MTATTSDILEAYAKTLNCNYFKNMEEAKAGIEALYKSITGYDYNVQMQAWQKILNDPESYINKTMNMWSAYSKNIDYENLAGLQAGVQRLADKMTKMDTSALSSLKTEQLFDTDTEIGKDFAEVYDCAYETAKEIEEPDIGKEELKNNIIEKINNKDAKKSTIRNSEFQKAVCKMICIILLTACTYLYHAGGIENASVIDFVNYIMEYIVPSLLASGLCNNGNVITNTCIEKNDKIAHLCRR